MSNPFQNVFYYISVEFLWKNNKIALIQTETNEKYVVDQYLITNEMEVKVCKYDNSDVSDASVSENSDSVDGVGEKKWILKKKTPTGQFVPLRSKRKSYFESKEKGRKSNM